MYYGKVCIPAEATAVVPIIPFRLGGPLFSLNIETRKTSYFGSWRASSQLLSVLATAAMYLSRYIRILVFLCMYARRFKKEK